MTRHDWAELPGGLRAAIESRCGPIVSAATPATGGHSDLAATVSTRRGQVLFCKGTRLGDEDTIRRHRHEAEIAPYLPLIAPGLLWSVVADGWMVNGFERIHGRHADLSPGSPDLVRVSAAINGFTAEGEHALPHPPRDVASSLADQWTQLAAWQRLAGHTPSDLDGWERYHLEEFICWETLALPLIDGPALCHTNLHPRNILIGETTVRLINWAQSRRAAPFVDVAILIIELIAEGHTPDQAENWASDLRIWKEASTRAVTGCSVILLGIWEYQHRRGPAPHQPRLIDAARAWVRHRMSTH